VVRLERHVTGYDNYWLYAPKQIRKELRVADLSRRRPQGCHLGTIKAANCETALALAFDGFEIEQRDRSALRDSDHA
jgi:hypothetical protein